MTSLEIKKPKASDGISYETLLKAYTECPPMRNPIVRYEIDAQGVVNLFNEMGELCGYTTREGLQYLLDNSPTAE
jgi:hypothetical protein